VCCLGCSIERAGHAYAWSLWVLSGSKHLRPSNALTAHSVQRLIRVSGGNSGAEKMHRATPQGIDCWLHTELGDVRQGHWLPVGGATACKECLESLRNGFVVEHVNQHVAFRAASGTARVGLEVVTRKASGAAVRSSRHKQPAQPGMFWHCTPSVSAPSVAVAAEADTALAPSVERVCGAADVAEDSLQQQELVPISTRAPGATEPIAVLLSQCAAHTVVLRAYLHAEPTAAVSLGQPQPTYRDLLTVLHALRPLPACVVDAYLELLSKHCKVQGMHWFSCAVYNNMTATSNARRQLKA
jgi:hypothetical protein